MPLAQVLLANPQPQIPPKAMCDIFCGHREFIALDIETHALVEQPKVAAPSFKKHRGDGELRVFDPLSVGNASELRCVQVSVARGRISDEAPVVKEWLVRPAGFEIEASAIEVHRITHERALSEGLPLQRVLKEAFQLVKKAFDAGACVTAYNLRFDAAVLRAEFQREGFIKESVDWDTMTQAGVCTMDPAIQQWLREIGKQDGNQMTGLKKVVQAVLPRYAWMLRGHNDAAFDAFFAWHLCRRFALDCGNCDDPPTPCAASRSRG